MQRVLDNPNNWMVHTMGLLLRSRLEANKSRTVERSVLQLQALVDQMPTQDSTVSERMLHWSSILIPSKWDMEVCFLGFCGFHRYRIHSSGRKDRLAALVANLSQSQTTWRCFTAGL
jgi:hypothetical protein